MRWTIRHFVSILEYHLPFRLAIGDLFGVGQTVTMGIVSAKDRGGIGITNYEDFIQTDASINPGNSGPIISHVKLIAEPWDVGEGGYQIGNFPVGWAEWNGRYRDALRRFWKGDAGLVGEIAYRLSGSSDLYQSTGRRRYASINFITAHDGFTLNDLVSYNEKNNEANGAPV